MKDRRCVDQLISVTRVFLNLLDPASPGALYSHHRRLSWKQILILQILQSQPCRVVDHAANVQAIFILVYNRYTAMVAHEVVFVAGKGIFDETILGRPIRYNSIRRRSV